MTLFCNIIIENNIQFIINICPFLHIWKDKIKQYLPDENTSVRVIIKSSSILICCELSCTNIPNIITFVLDFQAEQIKFSYESQIIVEINNGDFFSSQANVNMFKWIENVVICNNFKNRDFDFSVNFPMLKKIKFISDPNKFTKLSSLNVSEFLYGDNYNKNITFIPSNLYELILPYRFNSQINISHPCVLKTITFNNIFNNFINNLPETLGIIKFGSEFNQPVDNLPNRLEEIYFGKKFNQMVDMLPCSLKIIVFGNEFNQRVENLPFGLERIIFGTSQDSTFSHIIDNLPESVSYISISNPKYSKPINKLPKSLSTIQIPSKYAYTDIHKLTKSKSNVNSTNTNKKHIENLIKKQELCASANVKV